MIINKVEFRCKTKATEYQRLLCFREPEGIRTPNLYGRNVVHYPVMLRVHIAAAKIK